MMLLMKTYPVLYLGGMNRGMAIFRQSGCLWSVPQRSDSLAEYMLALTKVNPATAHVL